VGLQGYLAFLKTEGQKSQVLNSGVFTTQTIISVSYYCEQLCWSEILSVLFCKSVDRAVAVVMYNFKYLFPFYDVCVFNEEKIIRARRTCVARK